jgi:hypothetical protein
MMWRCVQRLFARLHLLIRNGNLKELVKNSINVYAEKTGQKYANGTALIGVIENSELQLGREPTQDMIVEVLADQEGALVKDETKATEPEETDSADPR